MAPATRSDFGRLLRQWRTQRQLTQLELALRAGTTPRHLSFLETGRSRPGRELVGRLCTALELPSAWSTQFVLAAGLPGDQAQTTEPVLAPVRRVLEQMLRAHEPFPAWLSSRGFRFHRSNRAAERLFPGLCQTTPEQIVDSWFGAGPFRERIENWHDVVWAGLSSLRRDARGGEPELLALLERAERLATALPAPSREAAHDVPALCTRFRMGKRVVSTLSTVVRFDTVLGGAVSDLRVELMFPADAASERWFVRAVK